MFEIQRIDDDTIRLAGKLDASQAATAREFLETVDRTTTLDLSELDYISSAGLGILVATQRRLAGSGQAIRFCNLNRHIRELFTIAGFHLIFDIE